MGNIEQMIPYGKENAIHLCELAIKTGLSDDTVKKRIHRARMNGVPIMSGAVGYWISDNEHEHKLFYRTMEKQAFSRLSLLKPLKENRQGANGEGKEENI